MTMQALFSMILIFPSITISNLCLSQTPLAIIFLGKKFRKILVLLSIISEARATNSIFLNLDKHIGLQNDSTSCISSKASTLEYFIFSPPQTKHYQGVDIPRIISCKDQCQHSKASPSKLLKQLKLTQLKPKQHRDQTTQQLFVQHVYLACID